MTVVNETFESAVNNWGNGTLSSESLTVGGHSLAMSGGVTMSYPLNAKCTLAVACDDANGCLCQVDGLDVCLVANGQSECVYKQLLNKNRTYLLSFWAKGTGNVTAKFGSADCAQGQCFAPTTLTQDWRLYNLGPVYVTWDVPAADSLTFSGFGANSFIDNIILTEVRDNIFVVKTTPWNIPTVCDQDQFGGSFPQFMLGCKAYRSTNNQLVNLKSFTNLCGEDKAGCEALIETKNSSSAFEQTYQGGDAGQVVVPADEVIYLVNDTKKSCQAADKGCQHFGLPTLDANEKATAFESVYLKNNPDKYSQILCQYAELGCERWQTAKGDYYFKDPKNRICQYQLKSGEKGYAWYKKDTNERCNTTVSDLGRSMPAGQCLNSALDGQTCTQVADCYFDPVQDPITFPYAQCSRWAAECPSDQSSCAEFIDPVSSFAKNILFNGNFSQDINSDGIPDGWNLDQQAVTLEKNTLYTISAKTKGLQNVSDLGITLNCSVILTSPDNSLSVGNPSTLTPAAVGGQFEGSYSARFYSGQAVSCLVVLTANFQTFLKEVKLSQTGLYYYLSDTVDQTSCNGLVDFSQGCVLFNRRDIVSSAGYPALIYDADLSTNGQSPNINCGTGPPNLCDTNTLLKVLPDRVCDKWFYCRSSLESRTTKGEIERSCLDVGLCDGVNERGECNSFPNFQLPGANQNLTYNLGSVERLQDLAGYVKVGYNWGGGRQLEGYRLLSNMPQLGGQSFLVNGNFEQSLSDGTPYGWSYEGTKGECKELKAIDNPVASQKEGLGQRLPEGAKVLRVGGDCNAVTQYFDIVPNTDNILSVWLNTSNLIGGQAQVSVENDISPPTILAKLTKDASSGWEFLRVKFNADLNQKIKIRLDTKAGSVGRFYIDDLRLGPDLNYQDPEGAATSYLPSSCRGYPDEGALSCDYNEAGVKKFGWWGYCLERDRQPANPDQCLLWWPVDVIRGEESQESGSKEAGTSGYEDRVPLYYALEGGLERYEYRHAYYLGEGSIDACANIGPQLGRNCSSGYTLVQTGCDKQSGADLAYCICVPTGDPVQLDGNNNNFTSYPQYLNGGCDQQTGTPEPRSVRNPVSSADGWYAYDGSLASLEISFQENCVWVCTDPEGCVMIGADPDWVLVCDNVTTAPTIDGSQGSDLFKAGAPYLCQAVGVIGSSCTLRQEQLRTKIYASQIAQVVTPAGQNKAWSGRLYKDSTYQTPFLGLSYSSPSSPFGSLPVIEPLDNPMAWDSVEDDLRTGTGLGIQPYYELVDNGVFVYNCSVAGDCLFITNETYPYPYNYYPKTTIPGGGQEEVKRLFAQSYGIWEWRDTDGDTNFRYEPAGGGWTLPTSICTSTPRPAYNADYCAILPQVENIKINNNTAGTICLRNAGFVNLTFNSVLDAEQQPLTAYSINWRDGSENVVSGVIQAKPNINDPHSLYHLYSYADLRTRFSNGDPLISCNDVNGGSVFTTTCPTDSACCAVQPKIQIKDNWGWCNGGALPNDCSNWAPYNGYVVVTESEESGCY
jgi:hypothetical protein